MQKFIHFILLITLSFQAQVLVASQDETFNPPHLSVDDASDCTILISPDKKTQGLILHNAQRMKTDTLALGINLKIKSLEREKFRGNLLFVTDSSFALLYTTRLSIDTVIYMFADLKSITCTNTKSMRTVGKILIIGGIVISPMVLLYTMAEAAFNDPINAVLPGIATLTTMAFVPTGIALKTRRHKLKKWTPVART